MEDYNQLSLYGLLKARALKNKLKPALIYEGTVLNYAYFLSRVDRMADILVNTLNIEPGDVVLISQPNIPDALSLFYAVNKIGAISNMVHPATPYNQVVSIIKKTKAKVAFLFECAVIKEIKKYEYCPIPVYITRIEDFLSPLKWFVYRYFKNSKTRKLLAKNKYKYVFELHSAHKPVEEYKWDSKATSVILHSGSTTGSPKSICISNQNFNSIVFGAEQYLPNTKHRSFLTALPSFHGFGLCMTMHLPIYCGGPLILMPKFSAKKVASIMNWLPINYIIGVPTIFEKLLHEPKFCKSFNLKNIDACYCGGDAIKQSVIDEWDETIKNAGGKSHLYRGYGLTECLAAVCINTKAHHDASSIGYPIPGASIVIRDDSKKEVKDGEIGEITISGPSVMVGYLNDEEATKQSIIDEYLYTGDLGYKKNGLIYFTQRKKRVVKVSGVAVFPSEIEELINSIHNVENCCAISIPHPYMQHVIKVYVVAKYYDEEGMKQTIWDTCKKYLIKWAVPYEIEFVKQLPYTLLGKIDFNKLQTLEDEKYQTK